MLNSTMLVEACTQYIYAFLFGVSGFGLLAHV